MPAILLITLGVPDPQVHIRGCSPLTMDGQGRALDESPEVWMPETGMSTLKTRSYLWDRKAASSTLTESGNEEGLGLVLTVAETWAEESGQGHLCPLRSRQVCTGQSGPRTAGAVLLPSTRILPLPSFQIVFRNELKKGLQRLREIRPSGTRRLQDGLRKVRTL